MSPRDLVSLLVLGALWGASFLFIKLGVADIPPISVVDGRMALGAITVLGYALVVRQGRGILPALLRPGVVAVAVLNAALPYLCFAWGETRVASGIAAIANAAAPVFVALIAHVWPSDRGRERLTLRRIVGVLVGLLGVLTLVGIDGLRGNIDLLGLLVVMCAPVLYAVGSLLARVVFANDPPLVPAATTNTAAAVLLMPLALLAGRPDHGVGLSAALGVAALGVGGTGIAFILYYRLLHSVGATRALSVTYLLPAFALFYGAIFLGEPVRATALAALVLILAGVGITNDVVPGPRRRISPAPAAACLPEAVDPAVRR